MNFELFKVQKTTVGVDFEKIYNTIKQELNITPDEYDEKEDYCYTITNHFAINEIKYIEELCGIEFDETIDDGYYDAEANETVLDKIYKEFEDYVYNLFNV